MKLTEGREANPFYSPVCGTPAYVIHTEGMIERVKTFDAGQCEIALALKGLQKTVRGAVERRLRKLTKL